MNATDLPSDELTQLISALLDDDLSAEDHTRLSHILAGDAVARAAFYHQVRMHAQLAWNSQPAPVAWLPNVDARPATSAAPTPILGFLGNAVYGSASYFSHGWPMAYLVATVILGLGLLAGNLMHVSQPVQVAQRDAPLPSSLSSLPSFVGRITGIVDCRWTDPTTAAAGPVGVPLGRKYALASGLMEITYHSGAKVILQGPCTFEVDSSASGFLSVGKLTARVEKKEERRTKNEELPASRSSFLIPHSYFAVRTPAATVTDLGTEFGVEVQPDGGTSTHVMVGAVEIAARDGDERIELTADGTRSAQVDAGSRKITVLPDVAGGHFVRAMPRDTRAAVLFDATFDEPLGKSMDGDRVGRYFTLRSLMFGDEGHAEAVLGNPRGILTLDCQAGLHSGSVCEILTRWDRCFPMLDNAPVRVVFSISGGTGGLQNDHGLPHRKWVGVTKFGAPRNIYHPLDTPAFYVTLAIDSTYKDFGAAAQHAGNIISIDDAGNKTFLASWDWGTYDGDNAQTVAMTLTSTTYRVELTDPGIKNLTGSLSGTLPTPLTGQTHVVAWCQGIEGSASLSIDRIRAERLPPPKVDLSSTQPQRDERTQPQLTR